jgi:hypothetical protein
VKGGSRAGQQSVHGDASVGLMVNIAIHIHSHIHDCRWEQPSLNVSNYYFENNQTYASTQQLSLWDAGTCLFTNVWDDIMEYDVMYVCHTYHLV